MSSAENGDHPMMPRFVTCLLLLSASAPVSPASSTEPSSVAGPWEGDIELAGTKLGIRVVFTAAADAGLTATIDIPLQGAAGLGLKEVSLDGDRVHFELPAGPGLAVFEGTLDGSSIRGDFRQGVAKGTFSLERADPQAATHKPSSSAQPAPKRYREVELRWSNGDIELAGTLSIPAGDARHPAAILISGSGAQDRDEKVAGFAVFATLADHLTRNGIAVLRYDDRGVGGSSGSIMDSTSADFADDVAAAVAMLAERVEIDPARIGLIGHSEGGIVASLLASRTDAVGFVVTLAGPALPGAQLLRAQGEAIARASGLSQKQIDHELALQSMLFELTRKNDDWDQGEREFRDAILETLRALPEAQRSAIPDLEAFADAKVAQQLSMVKSRWFRSFLDLDPRPALAAMKCPALALFGALDLQVPPDLNRDALRAALGGKGSDRVTIRVIADANHLFQEAKTGSPAEYALLDKEFVPGFLDTVTDWIDKTVGSSPANRAH